MNNKYNISLKKFDNSIKNRILIFRQIPYAYSLLVAIFCFVIIPLLICVLFLIGDYGYILIRSSISIGTILGLYGSILTAIGTITLGAIAVKQTQLLHDQNRLMEFANTKRPFFIIDRVTIPEGNNNVSCDYFLNRFSGVNKKGRDVYIYLLNIGEGIANKTTYTPNGFGDIEEWTQSECIKNGSTFRVSHHFPDSKQDENATIKLIYENVLGFKYMQIIECKRKFEPKRIDENDYEEQHRIFVELISPQQNIGMRNEINEA